MRFKCSEQVDTALEYLCERAQSLRSSLTASVSHSGTSRIRLDNNRHEACNISNDFMTRRNLTQRMLTGSTSEEHGILSERFMRLVRALIKQKRQQLNPKIPSTCIISIIDHDKCCQLEYTLCMSSACKQ